MIQWNGWPFPSLYAIKDENVFDLRGSVTSSKILPVGDFTLRASKGVLNLVDNGFVH